MTKVILTTERVDSIADLTDQWKIIATRADLGWNWYVSRGDVLWLQSAIYPAPGDDPKVSCVTGRDATGKEVLYVRWYPLALTEGRRA